MENNIAGEDELCYSDGDDCDYLTKRLASVGIDEHAELSDLDEECSKLCIGGGEEDERAGDGAKRAKTGSEKAAPAATPAAAESVTMAGGKGGVESTISREPENESASACEKMLNASLPTARGGQDRSSQGRKRGRNGGRRASTVGGVARWVCLQLHEKKYYLMCRVVHQLRNNKTRALVRKTLRVEKAGGMLTADGTKRRTPGGVFLTLLKDKLDAATLKHIYADDVKRKKARQRERNEQRRAADAALLKAKAGGGNEDKEEEEGEVLQVLDKIEPQQQQEQDMQQG